MHSGNLKLVLRIVALLLLVTFIAACSCRTKKGVSNIPYAEAGSVLKDVNFAFDKYDLDETAKGILQGNADWLSQHKEINFVVEGHCDERGTPEYNMALGQKRAQTVYDYLRGLGITAERMSTVSYGEELPLDPRHNLEAWAKNRRAHFRVERE